MRYAAHFNAVQHKPVQLLADVDNVGPLVGAERLFGVELMLQHGEIGFGGIAAGA